MFLNTKNLIFLLCVAIFAACRNEEKRRDMPDVSHIKADVKINRFEQALFGLDTVQIATSLPALRSQYGTFATVFFDQIIQMSQPTSADPKTPMVLNPKNVSGFINFKPTRSLYDTTQIAYKDLSQLEKQLSSMMQYYKYHFPKKPNPKFYSCVSEYSIGAFTIGDSIVGIGLDMFFGAKYPIYQSPQLNLPSFVVQTLDKEHLPVYVTNALLDDMLSHSPGNKMLDVMISNGKKQYILESLLPTLPDSVLHCYSKSQMDWVRDNEKEMWAFFLDQKLLYNTNQKEFRRFTEPAPNSNGMPPESPGRTANYIGYKIVEQYMAAFPKTTLQQLVDEKDAEKIFKASRYKPAK